MTHINRFNGKNMTRAGLVALALAAVSLPVHSARAGFEWTPPPAPVKQQQSMPPVMAAPAGSVEKESLDGMPSINPYPMQQQGMTPMGDEGDMAQDMMPPASTVPHRVPPPMPAMAAVPAYQAPVMPVNNVYAPSMPAAPQTKVTYDTVEGFGRDIPLALAMRQIVPPEYSYSFDKEVDPGKRISWNGGKPWNEVLEDSLRPLDLRIMISGENVWVRQTWQSGDEKMMQAASMMKPVPSMPPAMDVASMQQMTPPPPMMNDMPMDAQMNMSANMAMAPMMASAAAMPMAQPGQMQAAAMMDDGAYMHREKPALTPEQQMMLNGGGMTAAEQVQFTTPRVMATAPGMAPAMAPVIAPPAPMMPDSMAGPQPIPLTPAGSNMAATSGAMMKAPAPAMGGVTVMDPVDIKYWQAEQGESLKTVLSRWSGQAHVTLLWNSAYDYMLPMPVRMTATFPDALSQILTAYNMLDPRPVGQLHPNLPAGPSVLVIENYTAATN